jgi:hypothetical protein
VKPEQATAAWGEKNTKKKQSKEKKNLPVANQQDNSS